MYHNPVGPMAATGVGAGTALFALTPIGFLWAFLAAVAVAGAVGALMRVAPPLRRRTIGQPQPAAVTPTTTA